MFVPVSAQVTEGHRIKFKATSWSPMMASESAWPMECAYQIWILYPCVVKVTVTVNGFRQTDRAKMICPKSFNPGHKNYMKLGVAFRKNKSPLSHSHHLSAKLRGSNSICTELICNCWQYAQVVLVLITHGMFHQCLTGRNGKMQK